MRRKRWLVIPGGRIKRWQERPSRRCPCCCRSSTVEARVYGHRRLRQQFAKLIREFLKQKVDSDSMLVPNKRDVCKMPYERCRI